MLQDHNGCLYLAVDRIHHNGWVDTIQNCFVDMGDILAAGNWDYCNAAGWDGILDFDCN